MSEKRIKERCKRKDIAIKVVRGFLEKDCVENTELYYSLETVLDLINKQQKEIEKQKDLYEKLFNGYNERVKEIENSISKDKIREKIKDITEYYEREVKPEMYQWGDFSAEKHFADIIARYNELLEE